MPPGGERAGGLPSLGSAGHRSSESAGKSPFPISLVQEAGLHRLPFFLTRPSGRPALGGECR